MTDQRRVDTGALGRPGRAPTSLAHDLAVLATGELLTRAATFTAFVHLARVLEPAAFGLVELTLAVTLFLARLGDLGLSSIGARAIARDHGAARALVRPVVSAQIAAAGVLYGALVTAVIAIGTDASLRRLLLGYGLTLFVFPFVVHWVFQGRRRMVAVAGPQAARWAVFAIIVTLAVRSPAHVTRVAIAELIAVGVAAAVSLATLHHIGGRLDLLPVEPLDRRLLREGSSVCLSQAVWNLRMQLPAMIVAVVLGQAAVGLFGAANRLLAVSQAVLTMYFYGVFPRMSRVAGHALSGFLRRSVQLAFWPSLAIAIALCATAPVAIRLIFGADYAQGSPAVLSVLIWVLPVVAWRANARQALIVVGRMREEAACSLAGLILLTGLVTALSRLHGLTGAAWAMLASEIAAACLTWWRLRLHLRAIDAGAS